MDGAVSSVIPSWRFPAITGSEPPYPQLTARINRLKIPQASEGESHDYITGYRPMLNAQWSGRLPSDGADEGGHPSRIAIGLDVEGPEILQQNGSKVLSRTRAPCALLSAPKAKPCMLLFSMPHLALIAS